MLIGLPPVLGPELLHVLREMGHGDEIAIVDGNYPAAAHAARRLVRADGTHLLEMLRAILMLLPLDAPDTRPFARAANLNDPEAPQMPLHHEIDRLGKVEALRGPELYARIQKAACIVATSEPTCYANVILRKGVIDPASGAAYRSLY